MSFGAVKGALHVAAGDGTAAAPLPGDGTVDLSALFAAANASGTLRAEMHVQVGYTSGPHLLDTSQNVAFLYCYDRC